MGSARLQNFTRTSDGKQILIEENNILYAKTSSLGAEYIDVTWKHFKSEYKTDTFTKTLYQLRTSSENLINVTIDGISYMINGSRILHVTDQNSVAVVQYNIDGAAPKELTLGESIYDVKELVDHLTGLTSDIS